MEGNAAAAALVTAAARKALLEERTSPPPPDPSRGNNGGRDPSRLTSRSSVRSSVRIGGTRTGAASAAAAAAATDGRRDGVDDGRNHESWVAEVLPNFLSLILTTSVHQLLMLKLRRERQEKEEKARTMAKRRKQISNALALAFAHSRMGRSLTFAEAQDRWGGFVEEFEVHNSDQLVVDAEKGEMTAESIVDVRGNPSQTLRDTRACVDGRETLGFAVERMASRGLSRVYVLNRKQRPMAVVLLSDLARLAMESEAM